jgi:hypothetical protein
MGLYSNYMQVSSDPNSAINIFGDAVSNRDPAEVSQAFAQLVTSMDLTCAWQVRAAPAPLLLAATLWQGPPRDGFCGEGAGRPGQ